ncbi:MAG: hypothetical protein SV765_14735 [Pseudomonadota bacterium]|mgnify:CR=1 FL=1|nr:hypothetical protein [Pseudomonadales bacterium]MDY6921458.1 hypothetical protein [Pseudomonadota bacterium]
MTKALPVLILGTTLLSNPCIAGSLNLNLPQPEAPIYQVAGRSTPPITLATGPTAAGRSGSNDGMFTKDNEQYQPHWLTGSKAHQYLGLGALALVALAAVSPKEEDSAHEYFAVSATALAAGAATTGFIYHWDDFHFEDGFTDPDNLHMMLGLLGTLAMVAAVSEAPEAGHAGPGILGGVAMGTAIKITW